MVKLFRLVFKSHYYLYSQPIPLSAILSPRLLHSERIVVRQALDGGSSTIVWLVCDDRQDVAQVVGQLVVDGKDVHLFLK